MTGPHRAALAGTGASVPERTIGNARISEIVETDDAWIVTRTGIRERRVVAGGFAGEGGRAPHALTALATEAASRALDAAGIRAEDLDLVVVGTCTPDYPAFPATAPLVAARLGSRRAFGFDVSLACTGFIAALVTVEKYIAAGAARSALAIGADLMSSVLDWTDRTTCVIFGDGAGAAVLKRADAGGRGEILATSLGMEGSPEVLFVDPAVRKVRMQGRATFKFAVQQCASEVERLAASANVRLADLAAIVPHQVNQRVIEAACERLGYPLERVVVNIDRFGNTSAASVPIALDEAARSGRFRPGDLIGLTAFGAGLAWGGALLRW